jgi:uncharacterized protein YjbI with pentapeptide repeats
MERTSRQALLSHTAGLLILAVWLVASASTAQDIPPPGPGWSEPERWAWEEIRVGRIADFNTREGKLDPRKPDGWDDKRKVSPDFLKQILFREPHRGAIPVEGVRIIGAWFPEPVDLAIGRLDRPLWLDKCRFEGGARLTDLHVDGWLSLEGSAFVAEQPGADLILVDLRGAKLGALNMDDATVAGTLTMNGLQVGDLFMSDATFQDVDLTGANVVGQLAMIGATVAGTLAMHGLQVGQSLFMHGADTSFHDVGLLSANVGGQLSMDDATVAGTLNMGGLEVGQHLLMRNAAFQDVDLRGANVSGQLTMDDATVAGTLFMASLEVGQELFMRRAVLEKHAHLAFAHIEQNLDLEGTKLSELDLSATRIEGELHLAPEWPEGAAYLSLRNTHAGALQARNLSSWPDKGMLQLDGFTYDRLGGYEALTDTPASDAIDDYITWLARDSSYTPQPYEHLAAVLRATGEPTKANRILYESRERERAEASKRGDYASWFGFTLLNWTVGYGLGLGYFRALWWILGFTLIGTAVLRFSCQGPESLSAKAIFSLERLLPIVQLDEANKEVEARLAGGVKYYFYAHKLVGWVLASFLIAALAGLTQK